MTVGRFSVVAIDCQDPVGLADFYSGLTGWEIASADDEWVELSSGGGATIAFQFAPGHRAPVWPGDEHPQQMHLDFDVTDLDEGEKAVLGLGAHKAETQPGDSFRVFLDPAGHPFCLVLSD